MAHVSTNPKRTIILFEQAFFVIVVAVATVAIATAGARSPVHFMVSEIFGILVGSRPQNKFTCLYLLIAL